MTESYWLLDTQGDPLSAIRNLIRDNWELYGFQAMLLPLETVESDCWIATKITSPDQISGANPFIPLMADNIATLIHEFLDEYSGKPVAVLLRPCEVRTLQKIQQTDNFNLDHLHIISADCLGCYPTGEFSWRAERKGTGDLLAEEALHFSRLGGIASYRYRIACQLCSQPAASNGDINILIGGLPIQEQLIIGTPNPPMDMVAHILGKKIERDHPLLNAHHTTMDKIRKRNLDTKGLLANSLAKEKPLSLDALLGQINSCVDCQTCMTVCPIWTSLGLAPEKDNTISKDSMIDWILSCVGCGLCEENCAEHRPMAALFSILRDQLEDISRLRN